MVDHSAEDLAKVAFEYRDNAEQELKAYALHLLNAHHYDNLSALLEKAVHRGYSGFEWIDFLGCSVMDKKVALTWARQVIVDQKMDTIVEPFFNSNTNRLGIVLVRDAMTKYNLVCNKKTFCPLPLELREWKMPKNDYEKK